MWRNNHETLDTFLKLIQLDIEQSEEIVVSSNFLYKYDIEWIVITL